MQEQNGIPTFFDNAINDQLTSNDHFETDFCEIFERSMHSKENRFVSLTDRQRCIPTSEGRLFDGIPFLSSQGIHSVIKWKDHSLYKTNFDLGVPSTRFFDKEVEKYSYMYRESGQFSRKEND